MTYSARIPAILALLVSTILVTGCRQEAGFSANFPVMGLPSPTVAPGSQFSTLPPAEFESVQETALDPVEDIDPSLLEPIPGSTARTTAAPAVETPAPAPAPAAAPAPAPAPAAANVSVNRDVLATYARATSNDVGEKIYRRLQISREDARAACALYGSADAAQTVFLQRGGPAEDPLNLDSDGDGFACSWYPTPFRN